MYYDIKEQYLVDSKGSQTAILIDINDYHKLLSELEELNCIKVFDKAKNSGDDILPFEQAIAEIVKVK